MFDCAFMAFAFKPLLIDKDSHHRIFPFISDSAIFFQPIDCFVRASKISRWSVFLFDRSFHKKKLVIDNIFIRIEQLKTFSLIIIDKMLFTSNFVNHEMCNLAISIFNNGMNIAKVLANEFE